MQRAPTPLQLIRVYSVLSNIQLYLCILFSLGFCFIKNEFWEKAALCKKLYNFLDDKATEA